MKNAIITGCQDGLQKLAIITLERKESWQESNYASFQFCNENNSVALTLPLERFKGILENLGPSATSLMHGLRTNDYLIFYLAREDGHLGLVHLVAIRGGTHCIAIKFDLSELKLAIASLL